MHVFTPNFSYCVPLNWPEKHAVVPQFVLGSSPGWLMMVDQKIKLTCSRSSGV